MLTLMHTLRLAAFVTAGFAYAVIVVGFIVRITGSGMGCGPDWPLCNGRVIPAFTSPEVAIEWLHRVAVLGLSLLTAVTVAVAVLARRAPGASGSGGVLRPAALAAGLLVIQSLIGRQAVRLELDPTTVIVHLAMALALLAVMVILGLRAGGPAAARAAPPWGVLGAAALGAAVIILGGATANLGASWACTGFPLCSGRLWPTGTMDGLAHVHWTHRLLAYGFFAVIVGLAVGMHRRGASARARAAAWTAAGLGTAQLAVGAVMVLAALPPLWRGLHAAVGTAVWVVLVYLVWVSGRVAPAGAPAGMVRP